MKLKSVVKESTWQTLSDEIVELLEIEEMVRDVKVRVKREGEPEADTEILSSPKKAKTLMETLLTDDDDDEITVTSAYKRSHHEMAADEFKAYREMPKHSNPLLFYKSNRFWLPHVSLLATKYLVAQATSVASERVFSTSGDILSSERSCLDVDALDAMIFLKKNAQTADFIE